ncbi:endotype 6-aminohexanoat-oligomer hydrolase [Cotonvirus japonicus]|uniref:Endotype 6-aminohexanoat-oligomer hydrolase n=1 Tax=Cotonvirus japonicus TaxID=2811091 RepID=A0ABM7NRK8_9VIRU|nr:endotype 6-aminohexanoat-oligomer hydrolase [Cotonvirus japonicus]BCS82790.1 endotype 6-aminohexanoat-oligomer hydrolase [Cotonvirus japonicus]
MTKDKYLKYKTKYKFLKNNHDNIDANLDIIGGRNKKSKDVPSNDNTQLTPTVSQAKRTLEFDFPEISVASVEYSDGPTGCTYVRFNVRVASYYVDPRGGSVMIYASNRSHHGTIRGICFAGGSYLGLEAMAGCTIEELRSVDYECLSKCLVTGASLRSANLNYNNIYPDKNLGRFAVQNLRNGIVGLGQVGAGRMAGDGQYGQGAAFHIHNGAKIFVLTAVNALGVLYDEKGNIVRDRKKIPINDNQLDPSAPRNTTLTMVITDLLLTVQELQQLSIQCHGNMAVVIRPFNTEGDGDVLFSVSLGKIDRNTIPGFKIRDFFLKCSEAVNEAVLSCVER